MKTTTVVYDIGMEIEPGTIWPEYPFETRISGIADRRKAVRESLKPGRRRTDQCTETCQCSPSVNLLVECTKCNVEHATNFHPVRPGLTLVDNPQ